MNLNLWPEYQHPMLKAQCIILNRLEHITRPFDKQTWLTSSQSINYKNDGSATRTAIIRYQLFNAALLYTFFILGNMFSIKLSLLVSEYLILYTIFVTFKPHR